MGQICSAPVILNRNISLCDQRMLRSTSLIEGLLYVLHTKSILSARAIRFVNSFLVLVPLNREQILHPRHMHRW